MNIIDQLINYISPSLGLKRAHERILLNTLTAQERKFEGAGEGRRYSGWLTKSNSEVNELINRDLSKLVSRSRELTMNNAFARKAPVTFSNNVVGTGIIAAPYIATTVKDGRIIESKNNEATLAAFKASWEDWTGDLSCDYNKRFTFSGIQYLCFRTIVISGEVLIIRKHVKTEHNKFGIQLLVLEGDYIDTSKNDEKNGTRSGIKYDTSNKQIGYWIYDQHPSNSNAQSSLVQISDIIHIYDVERPGQARGLPFATSTIVKQKDTDEYEDAELLAKKAQACMPIFVTKNELPDALPDENSQLETLEPGAINYLSPGENVTLASPPSSSGYSDFLKTQHRAIAAGYLMTYEGLTGDLSNVNFSSGRMGHIDFSKTVEYFQYLVFIPHLCNTVFDWFTESAKISVGIDSTVTFKANWTAPRREMLDTLKEVTASRLAVRSGFTSWQNVVRENGYNPTEILEDLKAAHKHFKNAGLILEIDPALEAEAIIQMNTKESGNKTNKSEKEK